MSDLKDFFVQLGCKNLVWWENW